MAFGQGGATRVIESIIVGEFEDHVSPDVTKLRAHSERELERMKRSAQQASTGFNQISSAIKAISGIIALNEVKQVWNELLNFARSHNSEARELVAQYDKAIEKIMLTIVNSEAFRDLLADTVRVLNLMASGLETIFGWMDKLNLRIADFLGPLISSVTRILEIKERMEKGVSFMDALIGKDPEKKIGFFTAMTNKINENIEAISKGSQIFADYNAQQAAAMAGAKPQIEQRAEAFREADDMARKKIQPLGLQTIADTSQVGQLPGGIVLKEGTEAVTAFGRAWQGLSTYMKTVAADAQDMTAVLTDQLFVAFDTFASGVSGAFERMGNAINQGKNVLSAFAKSMLATAGQIASGFGDMFIKLGIATLFLNPAQGAGMIAAGAALKVLAGLLGGLSSPSPGKTASPSESRQTFRDFQPRSNEPTTKKENHVYIQLLHPGQLNDTQLRELGISVLKVIDKEEELGRNVKFA